jgi:hypothetical protein
MKIVHVSGSAVEATDGHEDHIHIFTQFFLPPDAPRRHEIVTCLRRNATLSVHGQRVTVHLLNERRFTDDELGGCGSQVVQEVIGHRLQFVDVWRYVADRSITGYLVVANADIFFDATTLFNLYRTPLAVKKSAMTQLRYEYRGQADLATCPLYGPRFDSQDTWIVHSRFVPTASQGRAFHVALGRPGCDNRVAYLLMILGYEVYNDPACVKTYHYHTSPARSYSARDALGVPWAVVCPYGSPLVTLPPTLGMRPADLGGQTLGFGDNDVLRTYVARKLAAGEPFVVPRVAGIENNVAVFAQVPVPSAQTYITNIVKAMKNNAGIHLADRDSVMAYSRAYLKAFEQAEMYCGCAGL